MWSQTGSVSPLQLQPLKVMVGERSSCWAKYGRKGFDLYQKKNSTHREAWHMVYGQQVLHYRAIGQSKINLEGEQAHIFLDVNYYIYLNLSYLLWGTIILWTFTKEEKVSSTFDACFLMQKFYFRCIQMQSFNMDLGGLFYNFLNMRHFCFTAWPQQIISEDILNGNKIQHIQS